MEAAGQRVGDRVNVWRGRPRPRCRTAVSWRTRMSAPHILNYSPTPLTTIVCGALPSLAKIITAPSRGPSIAGWKVTEIEQLAAAGSEDGQSLVCLKSTPDEMIWYKLTGTDPIFVTATACGALALLTALLPNLSSSGDSFKLGVSAETCAIKQNDRARTAPSARIHRYASPQEALRALNVIEH